MITFKELHPILDSIEEWWVSGNEKLHIAVVKCGYWDSVSNKINTSWQIRVIEWEKDKKAKIVVRESS